MKPTRRVFLQMASATAALAATGGLSGSSVFPRRGPDFRLSIEGCKLDIGNGVVVPTTAYNGRVPGPTLRLRRGGSYRVEVTNASSRPELVHWHGLRSDVLNDGAAEEGSPLIPPGNTVTYDIIGNPTGTRWYHTHAMAMDDLNAGGYSGQFGFLLVDGEADPGHYDQEVHLAIHHWGGHFVPMVETMRENSQNRPQTSGSDVGYKWATMNAKMLGAGEPVRVKEGHRVLFRLLNASATENVVLSLPGHRFRIVAMDGNPVPNPQLTETIALSVAERVDAIVEMNTPGVWVLGSTLDAARAMGLGVVVEYRGRSGSPSWIKPSSEVWDYSRFAAKAAVPEPEREFTLTIRDAGALNGSKFDTWTMNGDAWPKVKPLMVKAGRRYRIVFRNATGDQHPMHLHRHSFEVTRVGDQQMSGLVKDTVNVMPLQEVAVDFTADNPGDSLLHCHQQLHMDYGFMQIVKYES